MKPRACGSLAGAPSERRQTEVAEALRLAADVLDGVVGADLAKAERILTAANKIVRRARVTDAEIARSTARARFESALSRASEAVGELARALVGGGAR